MNFKSVELFAGAGGLALGVEKAGFNHIAVYEYDSPACETLKVNREKWFKSLAEDKIILKDVREVDFTTYKDIDLLVGGPPCQPFSLGGKHQGFKDKRDMFPEMIRAIREIKPKMVLIENVKGFNRETFASYKRYVLLQIEYPNLLKRMNESVEEHLMRLEKEKNTNSRDQDLSYDIKTKLINAADYGVPQKRERFFIVGIRKDLNLTWEFPDETHSNFALEWSKYYDNSYWLNHEITNLIPPSKAVLKRISSNGFPFEKPWVTVRDALKDLKSPEVEEIHEINHFYVPGARVYPGHTGSLLDFPSKTVKAGDHGVPGGENMLIQDDGSPRYYSVREAARIQTFPDDYVFSFTWGRSLKQIGNAVPVKLAEIIAKSLHQSLSKNLLMLNKL